MALKEKNINKGIAGLSHLVDLAMLLPE